MKGMQGDMTKMSGKILGRFTETGPKAKGKGKAKERPRLGGRKNVGKKNAKGQTGSK